MLTERLERLTSAQLLTNGALESIEDRVADFLSTPLHNTAPVVALYTTPVACVSVM